MQWRLAMWIPSYLFDARLPDDHVGRHYISSLWRHGRSHLSLRAFRSADFDNDATITQVLQGRLNSADKLDRCLTSYAVIRMGKVRKVFRSDRQNGGRARIDRERLLTKRRRMAAIDGDDTQRKVGVRPRDRRRVEHGRRTLP